MDSVSHWFPPLTNREVLTILGVCAIAIVAGLVLLMIPFQRRLRAWAGKQGYQVLKVEALSSYYRWWNTVWRVTLRDHSGTTRVGVVTFVGFLPVPTRLEVQWEASRSD